MQSLSPLSLADLVREDPNAHVHFVCTGCGAALNVLAVQVIIRLETQGLGDEETDIRDVGRFAERPCHHCSEMRWETRRG